MRARDDSNFLDRLEASRVEGRYARMVSRQSPAPDAEIARAVEQIREWMRLNQVSNGQLADQLGFGFSRSVISQIVSGTYQGETEKKVRLILKHIDNVESSGEAHRPTDLVMTNAVKRMMKAVKTVHTERTMGLIVGPAGWSKTSVAEAAHQDTPGSIFVRVLKTSGTAAAFLRLVARAMGEAQRQYRSHDLLLLLIDKLKNTKRLIIIDEAHRLKLDALEVLRDINDVAGVPIVLFGTSDLHLNFNDTEAGAQLYSRAAVIVDLNDMLAPGGSGKLLVPHSVEDVLRICKAEGLRFTGDALDLLFNLANTPGMGALRTCQRLIAVWLRVPGAKDRPTSAADLWSALQSIKGIAYKKLNERCVDDSSRAIKKASA